MKKKNDDDLQVGCFLLTLLLSCAWLAFIVWVIIELVTWITSK